MATGEYEGRKVKLDDPFRLPSGAKKKFGVYVKNPDTGNVIMVKYGDPNLSIKRDEPGRLKNFRARHNCDSPGPKTKARFWSCKFWEKGKPVSKLLKQGKVKEDSCDCGCDVHEDTHWKDKNDEREHNKLFMQSLKVMPGSPKQKKIVQQMNALRKKNGLELLKEEAYLPGQATTSRGGKSGRGGKPGPRMSRQRKNRAAVLDHLILNGIRVLNQPADVRQKGSSDTFVVAKKDLKRATDVVDDYFSKPYVKIHMRKNQLRRENYKIIAEDVNEVYKDSGLGDWFGKGGGGGKEEGGWDRYNTAGERIGKCGDAKKGAAYSACLSAEKAKQLGKKGIADFVNRKRAAQKKAGDKAKGGESKKGQKPVMVKTGAKGLDKKNESYMSFKSFISEGENKPNNPALWKKAIAKAKEKFDVYPSAYANAWASKWYKSKGGTWSKK